ncbi:Transposon Ty3-I Gag-Pol polyprotein [Vitis vinifera]|uniref:Transposon Ty3-I Gag-Pol polyprotein n=1 Tax=Vitis vinifera TaxID=29760 RepID=A0A438J477_VITVI|nr:Transposon Ty3-I Gag-Pol polyprotein [Vitis vinifera]
MESTLNKMMDEMQNDLSQKIDNVQYAISRLTNLNIVQEKRKFPSQPHQNPKGIHEMEAQEGEYSKVREVKEVITLRSGKEVDQSTSKPKHDEESVAEKKKSEEVKGKRKGKSTKKDDHDSSVDEEPERIVIKKDMMKKHMPPPFLQALHGKKGTNNASKKFEVLRQVKVNIPLLDMIKQCKSPVKYKDLGCPTISMSIGGTYVEKALLDLGASVNLLPYFVYKQLGLGKLKPTSITLSLADRSVKIPRGMIEDVLVQVDKFYYPLDFVVLDTDPIVKGTNYHIHLEEEEGPKELCMIDTLVEEHCDQRMQEDLIESFGDLDEGLPEPSDLLATLPPWRRREEILPLFNEEKTQRATKEDPPKLILKPLPTKLKYAYLEEDKKCPVVISLALTIHQEDCLLEVLRICKKAIEWQIVDLKGIDPLVCTHHIYMEDEAKPVCQPRRRLNPHMPEVVQAEVLKLLQAGIIYPISDSLWVSPTQVVPKKSEITVVQNDKGEEVSTHLTTSWKVCIDYRRLNAVARKDHFPLPFIDQVLERVSEHPFYCFLDGYSGYFHIEMDVEDQENTTFSCPFGTYAYRRMPFGLCNALATFQIYMLGIFSDMVEHIMEVFMDDITIYGSAFDECLVNLEAVLNRCIEKNLVLN